MTVDKYMRGYFVRNVARSYITARESAHACFESAVDSLWLKALTGLYRITLWLLYWIVIVTAVVAVSIAYQEVGLALAATLLILHRILHTLIKTREATELTSYRLAKLHEEQISNLP